MLNSLIFPFIAGAIFIGKTWNLILVFGAILAFFSPLRGIIITQKLWKFVFSIGIVRLV